MKGNVIMAKVTWYRYIFGNGSCIENRGRMNKRELARETANRGGLISCVSLTY